MVKLDEEHGAEFEKALSAALKNGWSRASDAEKTATGQLKDPDFLFVYCSQSSGREGAMLAICRKDADNRAGATGKRVF